jgi:UDP-glucose 4-epimerase
MTVRVLVTGAAGFIGSHVVDRLLNDGFHVIGIDNLEVGRMSNLKFAINNPKFDFKEIDIRDSDALQKACTSASIFLHLAALADIVPSVEKPDKYFETNVVGTFNLMQIAREIGVKKVIYIASSSCYGIPANLPTTELEAIRPQYPYALTKYLGESLALHWGEVYKISTTSLRLFNVFGPRARTSGTYGAVFGVFLAQKNAGKPFTVVGNGDQTRDFTYVSDVVEAIVLAMNSTHSGVFNVGSGGTYSINRLVELLGGDVVKIPKRPGEPDSTFADITKIRNELGWSPKTSFEAGVENILKSISDWKDGPVWDAASIEVATQSWFKYLNKNE